MAASAATYNIQIHPEIILTDFTLSRRRSQAERVLFRGVCAMSVARTAPSKPIDIRSHQVLLSFRFHISQCRGTAAEQDPWPLGKGLPPLPRCCSPPGA